MGGAEWRDRRAHSSTQIPHRVLRSAILVPSHTKLHWRNHVIKQLYTKHEQFFKLNFGSFNFDCLFCVQDLTLTTARWYSAINCCSWPHVSRRRICSALVRSTRTASCMMSTSNRCLSLHQWIIQTLQGLEKWFPNELYESEIFTIIFGFLILKEKINLYSQFPCYLNIEPDGKSHLVVFYNSNPSGNIFIFKV